jgi:hypothetical protein
MIRHSPIASYKPGHVHGGYVVACDHRDCKRRGRYPGMSPDAARLFAELDGWQGVPGLTRRDLCPTHAKRPYHLAPVTTRLVMARSVGHVSVRQVAPRGATFFGFDLSQPKWGVYAPDGTRLHPTRTITSWAEALRLAHEAATALAEAPC